MAVLGAFALAACAGPAAQYPQVSTVEEEAARTPVLAEIIDERLARRARLFTLAWPVLRDNAALCGQRTRRAFGWVRGDEETTARLVGQVRPIHVKTAAGIDGQTVLHVIPGSPAAAAGITSRDRILAVEGVALPDRSGWKAAERKRKAGRSVTVVLQSGEASPRSVTMAPIPICDVGLRLDPSSGYGGYTDGDTIWLTSGMLRDIEDDRQIQFVVGHELAHALGRHPRKTVWNSVVTGAVVIVPVVAVGGAVVDSMLDLLGREPVPPPGQDAAAAVAASLTRSRAFEREADYVGLYLFARINPDLDRVGDIFRALAAEGPLSAWRARSHPNVPERLLALERTAQEIRRRRAAGEDLVPHGFKPPE